MRALLIVLAVAATTLGSAAMGRADPVTECQQLWVQRNQIYKNHGYCFKTRPAIEYFGNEGCRYTNQNAVPLTRSERSYIAQIVARERALGCHITEGPPVEGAPPGGAPPPGGPAPPGEPGDACKKFPGLC